jgi:MoaA/NifB/PqqE/SkfB family radical SAM enzyme
MSMSLFKKVLHEYAECGGGDLNFTPTVGEPLVDTHIIERIRYARSISGIKRISMYSNLIRLEKFGAKALVDSGLTALTVSMSGFDEAMYRRVFRSPMYERVLKNIREFAAANRAAGSPVDLRIDMRVDRSLGEVSVSEDLREIVSLVGSERIGVKFRYDSWAGKVSQRDLSGNMRLRQMGGFCNLRISACSEMYSGPMVYWDGRVGACGCRDVNASELIIGDATSEHIGVIWFGEGLRQMRQNFLTPRGKEICKACSHYHNVAIYLRPDRREIVSGLIPSPYRVSSKLPRLEDRKA